MPQTYTTHDVARFCGVYPSSVVNWINSGKLKSFQTAGGHHRVTRETLLAFMRELNVPVPREISDGLSVLIVDDDAEFSRMLKRALDRCSDELSVSRCADGVEALIRIGQEPPALVVLDIVLPRMDGVKVCEVLKSHAKTRDIKIIAVTGKKLAPASERKLADQGVVVLRKPLDVEDFCAKALRMLNLRLVQKA